MRKSTFIALVCAAVLVLAIGSSAVLAAEAPVKLGLGHITSIAKSQDLSVDGKGNVVPPMAQVDSAIAAVAFDAKGRVVKVTLDSAQSKINFNKDFSVASDLAAAGLTKVELGDNYGMRKASSIGKEWNEQIASLEEWMVGKTVPEIMALKVKERDAAHLAVPDVPELTSSVTITVQDYLAAVEKAWENAVPVATGGVKLGLGHEVSIASSKPAAAQVNTTLAATLFDKNGKVVGVFIDTIQTKVPFDTKTAKVTADRDEKIKSKKELGDAYGMVKGSAIKKEWHEQIAALEKWMIGKTAKEIQALKVREKDANHIAVPDVPELTSRVTMTVESFLFTVGESYTDAR
ncbi:MAG: hypothetical protein GX354_04350 [Firmicutes bacterium]|jgi:hypothetical protein|nr:hypothetical protein [Bacillota bacterium]